MAGMTGKGIIKCPKCGSNSIIFNGWKIRKGFRVHVAVCKNCGTYFTTNIKEPLPAYRQVKKGESIYEI